MDIADLVLINGKIWTVDASYPVAESVAVKNGKIIAVGSSDNFKKFIGVKTRVIDLKGKLVLPGFHDSHTHFVSAGFNLMGVDLKDAKDEEEFGKRLALASEKLPKGVWITGGNWDHDRWPGGKLPTAELIDKYVKDRPVLVNRYDAHMSVANTIALKMAGISLGTKDPEGGQIVRISGTSKPSGVLRETADLLVRKHIPSHSKAEIELAIKVALKHACELGLTSIQQVDVEPIHLEIYRELLEKKKLTSRIYGFIPLSLKDKFIGLRKTLSPDCQNWITLGGLKAFLDGSLGSMTAVFFEPYVQDPSTSGLFVIELKELKQMMLEADRMGVQMVVHSIGDRANFDLLNIYSEVEKSNGKRDHRHRIEHAQHIHPDDYKRFKKLRIIASMQPYHAIDDGRFAEKRIGSERCKNTFAFKSFLKEGATLAFGSDWDVAPLDPILGIYAAVTRRTLDGKYPEGWIPEQKISVEEAIKCYTSSAAYSSFQEEIIGSISPGKIADLVVLSDDILTIDPVKIKKVKVICTIVNGSVVYNKDSVL